MKAAVGAIAAVPPRPLFRLLTTLGLTTSLVLALDAGEAASYTSGQSWLDRSGNGYDFFLGATGGAAADDPTFNGVVGRCRKTEYFGFDGGDMMKYDSANETWMNALHKDSALFSVLAWMHSPSNANILVCGTTGELSAVGVAFETDLGPLQFTVVRDSSATAMVRKATTSVPINQWNMIGLVVDEAASSVKIIVNSTIEEFTNTYTSPSTASAGYTFEIGSLSNGVRKLASGSRVAGLAAWSGRALSNTEIGNVRSAMARRFT